MNERINLLISRKLYERFELQVYVLRTYFDNDIDLSLDDILTDILYSKLKDDFENFGQILNLENDQKYRFII
jgi:hypothetical protein